MTLPKAVYPWRKAAAALLFPRRYCLNCGTLCPEQTLCPACREWQQQLCTCPDCATFIASTEPEHYRCADCRHQPPAFAAAAAALPYEDGFRRELLAFKYRQKTGLRRPLAALMWEVWQQRFAAVEFDAIVPVPLHPRRLAGRGYNQAELLARLLAAESGVPLRTELLRRVKETPALAGLDRRRRGQALQGAFVAAPCRGLTLLLADDIITTGATADTAGRALLRAGAAAVYVLAAAAGRDL